MATIKDSRLNLRLRSAEDDIVRRAAAALGVTVSDFLTSSAVDRAHQVVADIRHFELDDDSWAVFVDLLDRPARPDPALTELFARPQRIAR